jgi:hypothetical protein
MNQAEKNAAVAGSPRPFELGGRTLLLYPPTLADATAIGTEGRRLLQGRASPLEVLVNDPAFGKLPPACQVAAVQEAARLTFNPTLSGMDLAFELSRPPLLAFAVWLLARKGGQNCLTLEEIRKEITEESAGETFVRFVQASGILDLGNSIGASG